MNNLNHVAESRITGLTNKHIYLYVFVVGFDHWSQVSEQDIVSKNVFIANPFADYLYHGFVLWICSIRSGDIIRCNRDEAECVTVCFSDCVMPL